MHCTIMYGTLDLWGLRFRQKTKAREDPRESAAMASVERVSEQKAGGALRPVAGQKIYCHYVGTLLNGQKFDSSRDKRRPFSFTVGQGQVIQAWEIIMLKELTLGQRATFKCPSSLCYGPSGAAGVIPPNADLIFDIELLAVGDQCASGFVLPGQSSGGCVLL